MNMVFFLSDLLSGTIRLWAGFVLICRLLNAERPDRRGAAAAFAAALLFALEWRVLELPFLYSGALECVLLVLFLRCLRRTDTRKSLFLGIYYEMSVYFWQFLLTAGLGILSGAPAMPGTDRFCGQAALWLLHLLLLFLACYLTVREDMAGQGLFPLFSRISVVGLLAVVTLSVQTVLFIPEEDLFQWTILSIVLMTGILIFHVSRQYELEKELAELRAEQASLLERDYTTLNRSYETHARLFHDLHHHAGILRQLLLHEKYEEAVRYLDELYAPVRALTETVWTGDEAADYLISEKAKQASDQGIRMEIRAEYPRRAGIRSADLCAILGNLLDNGMEAAGRAPSSDSRFVSLTIRRINQMLVIKVENSFVVTPVTENGALKSTKQEPGLHGWGLKSAQTAAEKYDGMVRTSTEGNIFRAVATLSWQGVPAGPADAGTSG